MDIDRNAPVITRDEILIAAPLETIWNVQTNIPSWPTWQPEVDAASIDGPLAVGTVFHWQTSGLHIGTAIGYGGEFDQLLQTHFGRALSSCDYSGRPLHPVRPHAPLLASSPSHP